MGYFDKTKKQGTTINILLSIIGILILLNLLAFKMVANIAENKTINIQVPAFMDSGDYVIGNTRATDNVYKMWGRIWMDQLANYSYKDIDQRIKYIEPFLATSTMFKNKAKLKELSAFVRQNFLTQEFKTTDISIKKLSKGFVKIIAKGTIYRTVGLKKDKINGIPYTYEIVAFTRNGQVYIKNVKSFITTVRDSSIERKLKNNPYVDFDNIIAEKKKEWKDGKASRKKEKERLQQKKRDERKKIKEAKMNGGA